MSDYGSRKTDIEIAKLEKRIKEVYAEAERDLSEKIRSFNAKFNAKEAIKWQERADGKITPEEYSRWLSGQAFQSELWQAKRDQIVSAMHSANKIAIGIVNGRAVSVFAFNSNYQAYQIEKGFGVNFGFGLYDGTTVANLLRNDPQILPKWKINEKKDYIWNYKKVNNAITQGIIQGERLDQITDRLASGLCAQNMNAMRTFARTGMTQAQNAGRFQRQMDARKLGINLVKEWMATLDGRTRDSHRHLDGEQIKVGDKWHPQKFSNGLRYPGDPEGPAREVYNCRCTLVADLVDYPAEYERYDNINGRPIKNMTYDEWAKAKSGTPVTVPKPIKVDKKAVFAENIMKSPTTSQMTEEQKAEFRGILDGMTEEHLEMYETMTKFHGNNDYKNGGGWYSPSKRIVEMNLSANKWEKTVGRIDATGAWKTKFHEELHQLDHVLGITHGYGPYSAITACEQDWWDKPTPIGMRLRGALKKDIEDFINTSIDYYNDEYSLKVKHIKDLDKPIPKPAKDALFEYMGLLYGDKRSKASISAFTDAVGLMTKNRVDPYSKGYWGHVPSYQKEKGPNGATSECFAEIGSHILRRDTESLDVLKNVMPNSVKEYESVIHELAEYMKANTIHY